MDQQVRRRQRLLPALEAALGTYDEGTARHSGRVAAIAQVLGEALGLSHDLRIALGWAGALHDVGKLSVHESILRKRGPLSPGDWVEVRRHPDVGADLLLSVAPDLAPVADAVRTHHERWDGTGYPNGTSGDAIPILGRILAVADGFDSMISARPYRGSMSADGARRELERGAGTQFDATLVRVLLELHDRGRLPR